MKKIIAVGLLLIFGLCSSIHAQNKPFVFGFKIAPNTSWMKPDTKGYESNGAKTGFSWGLMAEFHLMENYKVNSGLNIITNGGTIRYNESVNGQTGELNRKYNLKYFQIPLTLKMKTNDFGNKAFYGLFGFGANFLLSAKANDQFLPGNGQVVTEKNDIKSDIKSSRISLILGAGMEYELGGAKMVTGINFDNGIIDILKGQNLADPNLQHKSINNFLEIYIGILF